MANYTTAQIKTKLQARLRDTDDSKWTSGEKDEIIQESINDDPELSYEGTDTSLTSSTSTRAYTTPSGIDQIKEIVVTSGTSEYPQDDSIWNERAGKIHFSEYPSAAGTMRLVGRKQYTIDEDIPDKYLNYILSSCVLKAYDMLMVKYQSGILMSDVTQAEIISALNLWKDEREKERAKLANKFSAPY